MYIIFSDVDGTLIDYDLSILQETINDIKYAQLKKIKFAISTGNAHFQNMRELSKKINADYLITCNGSRIFDFESNSIVYKSLLKKDVSNLFINEIKNIEGGFYLTWISEETLTIYVLNDKYRDKAISMNKTYHMKSGNFLFSDKVQSDIYILIIKGEKDFIEKVIKIASKYKLEYSKLSSNSMWVSQNNSNKGKAVEVLVKKNNTLFENIMTIGDGFNDISMLDITDNSYVMANAHDDVKKHAKRHASSVEQNGLGEAIIDFIYRKKL